MQIYPCLPSVVRGQGQPAKGDGEAAGRNDVLPTTVATEWSVIRPGPTATPAATSTTSAVATAMSAAAAAAVAGHFSQARINLLFGFGEDVDEFTRLFRVYRVSLVLKQLNSVGGMMTHFQL